jgi:predicted double-glycine peptidase
MQELKIRNLLIDHSGQEVCLKDLIHKLTDCGIELAKLEYKNTSPALKNSKRELAEFEKMFTEFKLRIRNKVTQEVIASVSNRDKAIIYGNPKKLVEHREKMLKNKIEDERIENATKENKQDYF